MSIYAIGDVQGCFVELQKLLELIKFDEHKDCLWFVGDLVNRGPDSLEVLRFVKALPNKVVALGNHDLHLLTIYYDLDPLNRDHSLDKVIAAPDSEELLNWLRVQPLLYHGPNDYILTHAGIYPGWDLAAAKIFAREAEYYLQGEDFLELIKNMYSNKPDKWNDNLGGFERLRFIINSFTRMRFCNLNGQLDFTVDGSVDNAPEGYLPWFAIPERKTRDNKLIFGHWAALRGETGQPNVYALDTGCVWGGKLTALCLDDLSCYRISCAKKLD